MMKFILAISLLAISVFAKSKKEDCRDIQKQIQAPKNACKIKKGNQQQTNHTLAEFLKQVERKNKPTK